MKLAAGIFTSLPSLRTAFIVVTAALLVLPLSLLWLPYPDRWTFQLGSYLAPEPESSASFVKVGVPARELERFQSDVSGAVMLGQLLQGLHGAYTRGILLVLRQTPNMENYATDVVVKRLLENQQLHEQLQSAGVLDELEAMQNRKENVRTLVGDGALLLGIVQQPADRHTADNDDARKVNYLRDSQKILPVDNGSDATLAAITGAFDAHIPTLAYFRYETDVEAYPLFVRMGAPGHPLLWQVRSATGASTLFPDGVLAAWNKSRGLAQPGWRAPELVINNKPVLLSAGSMVYPMYSSAGRELKTMETVSLADLKTPADYSRFNNKTVIIGEKDSPVLDDVAATIYSLDRQAWFVVPGWYLWVEKTGLLLLLAYLFLLLPVLSIRIGMYVTGFIALVLLGAPVFLQVTQALWLPSGLLIAYLLIGHLMYLLWQTQKQYVGMSPARVQDRNRAAKVTAEGGRNTRIRNQDDTGMRQKMLTAFSGTRKLDNRKLVIGRYEIDSELGRGAMGIVYLGHDPKIARQVAIKTLNYAQVPPDQLKEMKERFFREARAAGKLSHPNIVAIHDVGEEPNLAFIAMDYVGGKPLSAYTKKGQLLPAEEVYWIIESVAYALGYAHEQGIVHRDIKPSNILYNRDKEEVKVADFGIARITDQSSTRTGETLGSPLYMSPEQIKGEKVTGQSDIFSLGITFYQLLTGELPFNGDSMVAITHQIVNEKFVPVNELNSKLPASAGKIINKALQKNPDKRYENAYDLMDDIRRYREKDM